MSFNYPLRCISLKHALSRCFSDDFQVHVDGIVSRMSRYYDHYSDQRAPVEGTGGIVGSRGAEQGIPRRSIMTTTPI